MDGDYVVVHGKQAADNVEMVIAGAARATKETIPRTGGWIRLQPANPTMPSPCRTGRPDQGVVVGVIRKY
jgi:SOS-response transcriptional repressor LexA